MVQVDTRVVTVHSRQMREMHHAQTTIPRLVEEGLAALRADPTPHANRDQSVAHGESVVGVAG
jgi:hypothetical protein